MGKGRKPKSQIRQNIVELLYFMKKAHGYAVYKVYRDIFPSVTMRSIYYHLKKGAALDEFKVQQIKQEKGNYTWGDTAQKVYYALGPNAKPMINSKVKEYFDKN